MSINFKVKVRVIIRAKVDQEQCKYDGDGQTKISQ
mgnify:CR=1 FL=1